MTTTSSLDMAAEKASASKRIDASPEAIFDLLADPSKHSLFDGSGMVQSGKMAQSGKIAESGTADRLTLGAKFAMSMKLSFLPYKIGNTVMEFEENRLIAWSHPGKHRWRYELEPMDDGTTLVTETFDWSTSPVGPALLAVGYPKRNLENIEKTLERLASVVEDRD